MADHNETLYLHMKDLHEAVMAFNEPGKPVLLYLHGGPGESVLPFAGYYSRGVDF